MTSPTRVLSAILVCVLVLGCASNAPEPRVEPPAGAASAPGSPGASVAYRLLIAPPEDQRESLESSFMTLEDLRSELLTELSSMPIFESITFDELAQVDLELRPIIVSDRVAGQEPNAVSELVMRFELWVSGSNAVVWSELYQETSSSDVIFESPVPPRHQLMLAHKANRRRIILALKSDLSKFLYVF